MKTLNELFNSGAKFTEKISFGKRVYTWNIDGRPFYMRIEKDPMGESWQVVFTGQTASGFDTTLATGQGDELKVFATVISIMKKFVKDSKPLSIIFSAKTGSRSNLYDRMIKKFATGYTVKKFGAMGDTMYKLVKK